MELTKKEIFEIARKFSLGKIKSCKIIKGGLVNHNYLMKTETGKYIIRIVGNNSPEKIKHLKLQFKILNFLKEKDFPYKIPFPLKANNSKEIIVFGKKRIWVYEMIEGTNRNRPNILQIKQMAKALATYHKYVKNLKGKTKVDNSNRRIQNSFKKMKIINGKTEADILAIKYKDFFEELFNKVKNINLHTNSLFLHGDFDSSNVLFHNGKLNAIIDFDETSYSSRIFDISVSLRDSCYTQGKLDMRKIKIYLKEYEKIIKLSKKEKENIIPIILYANVDFFVWAYTDMKKEPENRKKYMKEMIILTEDIIDKNIKLA
jgi:Ser/Thr protein kinase RdoA (MazF antagonist)|tara:strand:- start:124 stop:1074 length:951 start_codon:yes stop_codon:yes gene_type:complete